MDIEYNYLEIRRRVEQVIQREADGSYFAVYNNLVFRSVFQPIFDSNKEILGVESLIRIRTTSGEAVSPQVFFKEVEENNTHWVFYTLLCSVLHVLNFSISAFCKHKLFINVAPPIFELISNDDAAIAHIMARLEQYQIRPDQITYELMESRGRSPELVLKGMKKMSSHGIHIAMDDYGVEHSTIERAELIRPHYLKLDKSLLVGSEKAVIEEVNSAVALARKVGAKTIAEGIETNAVLQICQDAGIEYFQGYYLAMPEKAPPVNERVELTQRKERG